MGYEVSSEMMNTLKESCNPPVDEPEEEEKSKQSSADVLIELMQGAVEEFFANDVGDVYARFSLDGVKQVHPVRGSTFKSFLTGLYYRAKGKALSSEALRQVIGIAEAEPLFNHQKRKTFLRCANMSGEVVYDLANESWESVYISPEGWKVGKSPANMVRAANTLPQVEPSMGGNIDLIRPFLNVKSEADFILVVVWLAYCIAEPELPKPIICLHGSKGAGKSTFQRVLRRLIDPAAAELTSLPTSDSEMALQCDRNYLLSFDNLSKITPAQSDFLCTC
jgi:putative DNA primase/helicase